MLATPVSMKRLELMLLKDDAQTAAYTLAELEVIHLQEANRSRKDLDEFPAAEFHEIFHRIKSRYKKIITLDPNSTDDAKKFSQQDLKSPHRDNRALTLEQLTLVDEKIKVLWINVSTLEEKRRQLKERKNSIKQLQGSLQRFLSLDLDLSRIGKKSQFLNVLSGTISSINTGRLERALSLLGYVMNRYYSSESLDYLIIVGPTQQSAEVHELLLSADFREVTIPNEFRDEPEMIRQQLIQQASELDGELSQSNRELEQVFSEHSDLLKEVGQLLLCANPYASLALYLKGKGQLVALQGWVPESSQSEISQGLSERLVYPFYLSFQTPEPHEFEQVPTKISEGPLVSPFQSLVGQYGLPQYGEFDPGLLFALSYTLMFGMMFGDVGHGSVIVALAILFARKSRVFFVVGGLAGLCSICFGFLYGSVFGYEHILHPLWMSPMQDPQRVLLLALYWGMGFLIIANVLAIRNMLVRRQLQQALFSPQGLTALLLYALGVYSMMLFFEPESGIPGWAIVILVLLMSVILYYQWRHSSGSLLERGLVVMVEGLEFIISNVSATLSFLRVAAFALNHIALAAAVFALAAMLDSVGHWATIMLGNIFIIVLEGAIVAIQCLRLEYYEGFSRFFSGKGYRFEPLKTDYL